MGTNTVTVEKLQFNATGYPAAYKWAVLVDGKLYDAFRTKREAVALQQWLLNNR